MKNLTANIFDLVKDISEKLNTNLKNTEIEEENIKNVSEKSDTIKKEVALQGIKTDWKLDLINKKMVNQMQIDLVQKNLKIRKEMIKLRGLIRTINLKIKAIKSKLPAVSSTSICSKLINCDACTGNSGCGWCSMTQTCVEGNEKGPYSGECTFFDYKICSGPKECSSYENCNVKYINKQ